MRAGASPPPDRDAAWWAALEEQLGHHDTAERYRGGILPPGQLTGGREGDELVIRAEQAGSWRILQPSTPGQRCVCSAPAVGIGDHGREGERAVCPHGRAWRYTAPAGPGHQPRRWVELHGLARWWAARQARR